MTARIRSTINGINPISEESRNDLALTNVISVTSIDTATTYLWSLEYIPDGSSAVFSGSSSARSPGNFTVDVVGPYLVSLLIDEGLETESIQYVRLRAPTSTGLLLVAAGEGFNGLVQVPVDGGSSGWADNQNANLLLLESQSLQKSENLSDLDSIATAKTNLAYVADEVGYDPTTPSDWDALPTELGSSSDQLAARVRVLELNPVVSLYQRSWSLVTPSVSVGGNVSGNETDWFDLGLIHRLKITADSDTTSATFRLYADAAQSILLYEALAFDAWNSSYEDLIPFHYRDEDETGTLHYTISNNGLNASTFTIILQGIGG